MKLTRKEEKEGCVFSFFLLRDEYERGSNQVQANAMAKEVRPARARARAGSSYWCATLFRRRFSCYSNPKVLSPPQSAKLP